MGQVHFIDEGPPAYAFSTFGSVLRAAGVECSVSALCDGYGRHSQGSELDLILTVYPGT